MALSEAEKRRRRFLKAKKEAGDFYKLQINELKKDYTVWYLEDGTIVSVTKEKIKPQKDWKSTTFSNDQIEILKGKNLNLYRVVQDPSIETVFSIEMRPIESLYVRSEDDFVTLIDYDNSKTFDLSISTKEEELHITLHKKLKTKYKKQDIKSVTAKGKKDFNFYFTSLNDPHFLVYYVNASLKELIENDIVIKKIPPGMSQCSIYTIKSFDKYVRT